MNTEVESNRSELPPVKKTELSSPALTRKDFLGAEPRWCPGCGDFGVLKGLTQVFSQSGFPKEKFAVISGIGCSSRFPHLTSTYGFHTLHGRAPSVALGVKMVRPDLSVWVVTGDGDGLSIGSNHLLHLLRRNADIKVILFNNRIYGLTKGQTSPTSPKGHRSKTTPEGAKDYPVNPLNFAMNAGATFVARITDKGDAHMNEVLTEALNHKGAAFVEVLQNCIVFNDGAFHSVTKKENKDENAIYFRHGEKILFGKEKEKGLKLVNGHLEIIDVKNDVDKESVLTHDIYNPEVAVPYLFSRLEFPKDPYPIGIFYQKK